MQESKTTYPWRHAEEVLKQIQKIQEEARQAVAQARAERARARKLINRVTSRPRTPETAKDNTPHSSEG